MPQQDELTESNKGKAYQFFFTKSWFEFAERTRHYSSDLSIGSLRMFFNDVRNMVFVVQALTDSQTRKFRLKVDETLQEIEIVLYGNTQDVQVLKVMQKYRIIITRDRHGRTRVENAQAIVRVLLEIVFLLKQWALDGNLFLQKPYSKKLGTEAMDDAFIQ